MTIQYACEECNATMSIRSDLSGTTGHCPKCKTEFTVPSATDDSDDDEISLVVDDDEPVKKSSKSASTSRTGKKKNSKNSRGNKSPKQAATAEADASKTFSYKCESCSAVLQVREDLAGKKGNCPKCKTEFTVPIQDMEQAIMFFLDDDTNSATESRTTTSSFDQEIEDLDLDKEPDEAADDSDDEDAESSEESEAAEEDDSSVPDLARQLYKKIRKSEKTESEDGGKKKKVWGIDEDAFEEKEGTDWKGILLYSGTKVVPAILGLILIVAGVYWLTVATLSGGSGAPPLGNVSGVVTLNGKPLPKAIVMFQPISSGKMKSNVSASVGRTNSKGEYSLSYSRDYKGAAVGNHMVSISAQAIDGSEMIPEIFNAKTTLRYEVKSGSNKKDFDLTARQ